MNQKFKTFLLFTVCFFGGGHLTYTVWGAEEYHELQLQPVSLKMEGLFAEGQKIPDTDQPVPFPGWHEVTAIAEEFPPALLVDGSAGWDSCIRTYFWTAHDKRLEFVFDLGAVRYVDTVEVYQSTLHPSNLIEECAVYCASELTDNNSSWSTPQIVKQTEIQSPTWQDAAYPLSLRLQRDCRYIKVVCTTVRNGCIIVAEVKAFGREQPIGTDTTIAIPPYTYRLEAENIKGGYYPVSADLNGGKGLWVAHNAECSISLPEVSKEQPMYSFVRQFRLPVWININGEKLQTPQSSGWKWEKGPEFKGGEVQLQLTELSQQQTGFLDTIVFSADADFDPNKIDDHQYIGQIPEVMRNPEFAEELLSRNPEISPEEFAEALLAHYGKKDFSAGTPEDRFGNMLYNGIPFLPRVLWMARPEDSRTEELGLDTFLTRRPEEFQWQNDEQKAVKMFADITAFDLIAKDLLVTDTSRIAFVYLADEPDGYGQSVRDLQLLNALVKKAWPDTPTFINFASGSAMRQAFGIADFVGLDHYPISSGRVSDIGYSIDYMRFYSDNTPLLFIAQAFNWSSSNTPGRWPTPDEFSAMYLLSWVHGARGLLFYESPKDGPDSIQEQGKIYERLKESLRQIVELRDGLLGPEVKIPASIIPDNTALAPEFRFLVSPDRSKIWLLGVNPYEKPASACWTYLGDVLSTMQLTAAMNHGVEARTEVQQSSFQFEPFGTAIWQVSGVDGMVFEEISNAETLERLAARFSQSPNSPKAEVLVTTENEPDWTQSTDLLQTWKSDRRMEKARICANSRGLFINAAFRFRADRTSVCTERDGDVWADLSLELFIGKPGAAQYVHLMVNSLNVQADYYFNHESGIPLNREYNYQWDSQVTASRENIEFNIFISYDSLKAMCDVNPGEPLVFNLATGGGEDKDWAGLSGSGFQAPLKFGRLTFVVQPTAKENEP